jgi:hypothetical protein
LAEAISEIVVAGYLARIAGGKATWIVETGKPVAVVAQQWKSPKFLIDPATPVTDYLLAGGTQRTFFFRYWCQVSPPIVFDCLRLGRPLPDKYIQDV